MCCSPDAHVDPLGEVTLQPLPLYSFPSDNVVMCSVASTPDGRIFLGGMDGHLYEVQYFPGDTWRHKRCFKVTPPLSHLFGPVRGIDAGMRLLTSNLLLQPGLAQPGGDSA